ncbi:MAG: MFS transporter [Pseudomonadota bacterium]
MTITAPTTSSAGHHCPADKRKYVLIVAILASGMGFLDGSVVSIAIPQIRASLDASFAQVQWVHNSYILFLSALMLLGGAAGDRYGMKRVFSFGIVCFVVASGLCAFAWSPLSLIMFRAVQGAGAAIMIPGSMALISINTPRAERGKALGIWISASSITAALGPVLGGLILTYGGSEAWRWIFAINLPLGLIALALLSTQVPADQPRERKPLDFIGAFFLTAALALLAVGLTWLGERESTRLAFGLIVLSLFVGAGAVLFELRVRDPMIEMRLFRSKVFAGVNALTLLVWSGLGGMFFFLPMLLIVGWKLPATYAGGVFLPFTIVIAVLSPIAGRMSDRLGPRFMLTLGPVVCAVAFLLMGYAIAKQDFWTLLLPSMFLVGVGIALSASPLSNAVMNSVSDEYAGSASGINNMLARLSNLVAIAGMGAVVSLVYRLIVTGSDLSPELQELMVSAGFGERLTGALYQVGTQSVQEIGMTHAMVVLCLMSALLALLGALLGWLTQSVQAASDAETGQ